MHTPSLLTVFALLGALATTTLAKETYTAKSETATDLICPDDAIFRKVVCSKDGTRAGLCIKGGEAATMVKDVKGTDICDR